MKPSILTVLTFLWLLLRLSSASAKGDDYKLPDDIGFGPFSSCTGPETPDAETTYNCTGKVDIGKENTLVLNGDVTLNVGGEFKVADDSSVDKGIYVFNVSATKLHIDGPKSMIFDNLTATGKVHIHKKANLTANVTSTSGEIKIDGGNNTINGNITAESGYLNIDSNSNVNGTCIPSNDQCTPLPPMLNPTVASQTTSDNTPVVYGTYSSSVATSLNVTVNEVTYSLSTSSELTNSSDNWTLDLSSITPLPVEEYEVVATSADGSTSLSDNSSKELVIIEYSAEWWDTNWTKCRNITIANTGTTTLSNFPAYIDLPYDSDMQSNYNDIRFINTSCANGGLELDFEIETDTAASADVWVEIDNLPAAGTTIAVYYGNASAASGENIPGTWESSHKGVWHLSEDTDAPNQDSTINSNNGTPLNSPASITGKIGNALNFYSSDETSVGVSAADSLELSSYDNWTISLWVKPSTFGGSEYPVMYTYGDYQATVGLDKNQGTIEHYRNDSNIMHSDASLTLGLWQHVVVVYEKEGDTDLYLNGTKDSGKISIPITSDGKDSFIGGYSYLHHGYIKGYSPSDLKGLIDEVRVSKVARTPDWIKQSYDLVQDQGDHVTIGDEMEPRPEPSQCSAIFPDGASTHSNEGTIIFGENAQLIDSYDNQLATTTIVKDDNSNINTCNTADCEATGTPSGIASTVTFQTTTSVKIVNVNYQESVVVGSGSDNPGKEYKDINGSSGATITFSDAHNKYFVDNLILGYQNTLYLQAGATYWFNQLTMGSQSNIMVQGSGTALIYVNQELVFNSSSLINSPSINNSGDASKLVMRVFSNVTLNSSSTFTGSLYAQGDLKLVSSSYIFGAVSAANIQLDFKSTITYQSGEVADTDFRGMCDASPLMIVAGRATLKNTANSPEFTSVCFDTPFPEAPLVFSLPTTADDDDRLALRIRNVTGTGFEIAQVESPIATDQDLPVQAGNVSQTVDFLAIPEGDYNLDDGSKMSVGSLSTKEFQGKNIDDDEGWFTISFTEDLEFSQTPAIIASIQTMNNETIPFPNSTPFLATAVSDVDNTKFKIALERGETSGGELASDETIGFIAITPGSGELTEDISYESFRTSPDITGHGTCQAFNLNTYSNNPLLIASQNTREGNNGGWLKRCSITTSSVGFSIVEDQAEDAEGAHTGERAGGVALGGTFADMTCNTVNLHHYRIEHDAQGFTCEPETVTIKACADANCDTLYDQETSITLSPSGWAGSDTIVFTGETTTTLNVTDEVTVTLAKTSATPDANLRCFNGSTETCDIEFSNDGFEIYGENIGDTLPDQLAANNFQNVNLRAVRSNNNVCEALLEGTQNVNLTYDCDSPDKCLTPLNMISFTGDGSGGNTGSIEVEFSDQGVASLALLNYPDAGRLILSIEAEVDGVSITNSGNEAVDVYPSYLQLTVEETELIYGNSGEQNNYVAAESFNFSIGAYGVSGLTKVLLPNYQAENPRIKVTRIQPASTGSDGHFKYSDTGTSTAQLAAGFTTATGLSFDAGEHQYAAAYYDEVGRINIDVKDNTYLGNVILSNGSLTLGDFYPAYFDVTLTTSPSLADTCSTFSYIGENITFATNPELTITAYNALNVITENYSDNYWNYQPDESTLEANLSFIDSSTYAKDDSASVIDLGDAPVIASNHDYSGSGTVTINNGRFRYNKVDPDDNNVFAPVSPFDAKINLEFASDFFTSTFVDQNGNADTICYQDTYTDNTCLGWDIDEVTGTQMRYGRLTLESTYGPETESLNVPIKAEYFKDNQWLLNSNDNCTNIELTHAGGEIKLTNNSLAAEVGDVTSQGTLMLGVPVGDQLLLDAPNISGKLDLWLDPADVDVTWPAYLNYDWDGDGFINIHDFPKSTITFGQFRGNDRIIHWREVFN